jgi:hypothetical protein
MLLDEKGSSGIGKPMKALSEIAFIVQNKFREIK